MKKNLHITKNDQGWGIQPEKVWSPIVSAPTQKDAIDIAKNILRQHPGGGEVIIHDRKGKIRDADTINRQDPYPPLG